MECLLKRIPVVIVYLNNILVTGPSTEEHLSNLDKVLQKLKEAGLRLKCNRCVFMAESVTYLGHCIDSQGLHPVEEKVKALLEVPIPKELKSFLECSRSNFLPNLSSELAPLYQLLKYLVPRQWTLKQQQVFDKSKELLASSQVLIHFDDPKLEIRLACDASDYGIGAVLSQVISDGSENPVGFLSQTLTDAEKNIPSWEQKVWHVCIVSNVSIPIYLDTNLFYKQIINR